MSLEIIELALVVLGKPPDKVLQRAPEAIHYARYIAKLLYDFKIFLLQNNQKFSM